MNSEDVGCYAILVHVLLSLFCLAACIVSHFYPEFWAMACVVSGGITCVSASIFHVFLPVNDFQIFLRGCMLLSSVCLLLAIPLLSAGA